MFIELFRCLWYYHFNLFFPDTKTIDKQETWCHHPASSLVNSRLWHHSHHTAQEPSRPCLLINSCTHAGPVLPGHSRIDGAYKDPLSRQLKVNQTHRVIWYTAWTGGWWGGGRVCGQIWHIDLPSGLLCGRMWIILARMRMAFIVDRMCEGFMETYLERFELGNLYCIVHVSQS